MPKMCLCLVSVLGVVPLLSHRPQSSPKLPKNQYLEKSDPLTEKVLNFATKGFMWTPIHVLLPSFAEIGKAEVTKRVRGISSRKRLVFCPFLRGFSSHLAQFLGSLFPQSPSLCKVLSKSVQFSRRYIRKCQFSHYVAT